MKIYKCIKMNRGMTYIELIVVLSIFSILSSIAMFNYGDFQSKIDVKNLASDIALQVVAAQKSSLSGLLPPSGYSILSSWKPSYGVYFDITIPTQFIYFVDLNNLNGYEVGEELSPISITKNNRISGINRCTDVTCVPSVPISPLSIIFKRTDSGVIFKDSNGITLPNDFEYIQITVLSPKGITSLIKLYPSGRIQVN